MRIIKAGLWVSLGLLFGRLAGFVREIILANELGVGTQADQAILMFTVPDLLVGILAGGALSAALIPAFSRHGPAEARTLYIQASAIVLLVFVLLTACLVLFSEQVVLLFAPGMSKAHVGPTADLVAQILWMLPLITLAGVATAYLQANQRFIVPAFGTVIINGFAILGIYLATSGNSENLKLLGYALLAGGGVRLLSQWVLAGYLNAGLEWHAQWYIDWSLIKRYFEALAAGSIILFLPLLARSFSTFEGDGGLAIFNYALRLVEFPLGVGLTVLTVVLFPFLSRAFAGGDQRKANDIIEFGVITILVFAIVLALPLIVLADVAVYAVYGWGGGVVSLHLEQVRILACIGFLSLPAQALSVFLTAVFHGRLDTRTPFRIALVAVFLFVPAILFTQPRWGILGVFATLVVFYYLILATQVIVLLGKHRQVLAKPSVLLRNFAGLLLAVVVGMPVIAYAQDYDGFLHRLLFLILVCMLLLVVWGLSNLRWIRAQYQVLRNV